MKKKVFQISGGTHELSAGRIFSEIFSSPKMKELGTRADEGTAQLRDPLRGLMQDSRCSGIIAPRFAQKGRRKAAPHRRNVAREARAGLRLPKYRVGSLIINSAVVAGRHDGPPLRYTT